MFKIVCGMTAHNEGWVIGLTARAALTWCDELIVIDHCSEDNTQAVLEDVIDNATVLQEHITILQEKDPAFRPLRMYERLVVAARGMGATHLAILDADELVSSNLIGDIRSHVSNLPHYATFEIPWVPVRGGLHWRDKGPRSQLKTGFVFSLAGDVHYEQVAGNECCLHRSRLPLNIKQLMQPDTDGGLMHLQYVDERRLRAKQVRWKMMEMLRWPGRRTASWLNDYYDCSVHLRGGTVPIPVEWWSRFTQWEHLVELGTESWAEKEVKKLWAEDSSRFRGLNTFDLC